ncbi:MotA/TolQ/ExbB proton channel family protein [candidate division WOR-3 bacterium]|nr:MotA/TolQ/ExbB proton channel family protein [candidate division WOR-3 bacterium]
MTPAVPAGGGFFDPFLRAGIFAQVILFILLAASVVSWAIIIAKWRSLNRARKQTRQFQNLFRHRVRLGDYESVARDLRDSPLSSLLLAGVEEWRALNQYLSGQDNRTALLPQLISNVHEAMERAQSRELERLEGRLTFLAIVTSVAPFLGLLGTVQGVLRSFLALRGQEFVTLQNIAPGISDALITTVVGLVVAIPAAIFYNHFAGKVRDLDAEMDRFNSELVGIFRRETVAPAPQPQQERV